MRRLMGRRGILVGALALALTGLAFTPVLPSALTVQVAQADEREEAVQTQEAAESNISELQTEVEGLDAEIAQIYVDLELVKVQVTDAEGELAEAQEAEAAAEREYELARDQLLAAQDELARLGDELASAEQDDAELSDAVGTMARDLYRNGETSALSLVMTADGAGDISERAASASTMARAQTRALDNVRESITLVRNRSAKQEAVTERVAELEEEASEKLALAEEAREAVETKLADLEAKQSDLEAKQAEWDKRKVDAESQLNSWQAKRDAASATIAQIDEENRQRQTTFSSSSGGSGAIFSSPLPGGVVTSNYGWRMHPIFGYLKLHDGTDWGATCGSAQYAVREGVVVASYFDSGGGNIVTINHGMIDGSSWTSEHLHLSSAAVYVGQRVSPSTVVGYTGSTGSSTGCHLHLTITRDGATVNPLDYM